MTIKLTALCKKQALTLHPTYPLWMLGGKHGSSCDFYIESENEIYAVKLFGAARKSSVLVFDEGRTYRFRKFMAIPTFSVFTYSFDGKKKPFKAYDLRKNFRSAWENKATHNILLLHPVCREVHYQPERGKGRILGNGDGLYEFEISDLSGLLARLRSCNT